MPPPRPGYGERRPGASFLKKNVDLAHEERVTVEMSAVARNRWYEWDVQVDYLHGDADRVQRAYFRSEGGEPFRLTGLAPKFKAVYGSRTFSPVFREIRRNGPCGAR